MALEPRASPGNAGLSPNSAFLLQPFVFFLLFPPRCFFPLLSKALCFFPPLSCSRFASPPYPSSRSRQKALPVYLWHHLDVCTGVSRVSLAMLNSESCSSPECHEILCLQQGDRDGTRCVQNARGLNKPAVCSQHGNIPGAIPACCSGGTHGDTGSRGAREGKRVGKAREKVPGGAPGKQSAALFGSFIPPSAAAGTYLCGWRVLAPRCCLSGPDSIKDCPRVSVARAG